MNPNGHELLKGVSGKESFARTIQPAAETMNSLTLRDHAKPIPEAAAQRTSKAPVGSPVGKFLVFTSERGFQDTVPAKPYIKPGFDAASVG